MEIENCIVHLIGFPGVGKLTVAREICAQSDFRLIDNHAINNLVFTAVRVDGRTKMPDEIWEKTRIIRETVLDTIRELSPSHFSFLFTNALTDEDETDRAVASNIMKLAHDRGSIYIPVHLVCDMEENKRRIVSPDRDLNMKQTDSTEIEDIYQNYTLVNTGSPYQFFVDVTHRTPAEAAAFILDKVRDISMQSQPKERREPNV
jgi:shikimate kinase